MPAKTLDEYLKQTTPTTTKQQATKPKYKIIGFYKETEFQDTPVGKIPKAWKIVRLYEIAEKVKAGGTPRVSKKEHWNGNIPFVKIEDLTASRKYLRSTKTFITELGLKNSNAWIVPEESLLLAMYGSMGEVAINKIKVATNQAILGIIPKPNITHVEYLYYWFLYFKPRWRIYAKWTTQPNLTAEIVKNSYVPLPPLEEQWGIAEVLSTLDKAIEETERLIGRLERLKRGLMQELLTKGIGHREYKQTPIGKIPKQWNISRLEHLASAIYYGVTAKAVEHNTGLKMLRTTDIKDYKVDWDSLPYCEITSKVNDIKKYLLRKGDLIVARAGTVGVSVLVDRNFDNVVFGSYLIKVRPKENIIYPKFLHYYFQSKQYWKHVSKAQGSTLKNINLGILKSLLVPVPPLEEQKRIVAILSSIDDWIELEKKRREKFERLKSDLMELLLTGRVRVRVEKIGEAGDSPGSAGVGGR